jgi:hypothetical protein
MDDISTVGRDADVVQQMVAPGRHAVALCRIQTGCRATEEWHQHESHVVEESAREYNAYLTRSVHVVGRTVESLAD